MCNLNIARSHAHITRACLYYLEDVLIDSKSTHDCAQPGVVKVSYRNFFIRQ